MALISVLNVAYGANSAQKLDHFRPSGTTKKRPAVLCIPGGGWTSASRTGDATTRAKEFANAGFVGWL